MFQRDIKFLVRPNSKTVDKCQAISNQNSWTLLKITQKQS